MSYIITHLAVYVNYKPGITNLVLVLGTKLLEGVICQTTTCYQNQISPLSRCVLLQVEFLSKKDGLVLVFFCYEVPMKFAYMFRRVAYDSCNCLYLPSKGI